MQRKFIRREILEKSVTSEENVVFLDSSPSSEISLPPKTVAVAIYGNCTARDIQGTLCVFREDSNDTVLLNTDLYSFNAQRHEERIEIDGPLKAEYHHIDDIPVFMRDQAPKEVTKRIQQIRRCRCEKVQDCSHLV